MSEVHVPKPGASFGVGSLPHRECNEAVEFAWRATDIPTIPSLPRRSPAEGMIAQALVGIEGVSAGQYGSISVDIDALDLAGVRNAARGRRPRAVRVADWPVRGRGEQGRAAADRARWPARLMGYEIEIPRNSPGYDAKFVSTVASLIESYLSSSQS